MEGDGPAAMRRLGDLVRRAATTERAGYAGELARAPLAWPGLWSSGYDRGRYRTTAVGAPRAGGAADPMRVPCEPGASAVRTRSGSSPDPTRIQREPGRNPAIASAIRAKAVATK